MSLIWRYFTIETPQSSKAKCNVCEAMVSRGGQSVSSYNTTNLSKHLKKKHAKENEELEQLAKQSQQPKISAAFKKREKLSDDSVTAKRITEKLLHFIVLDDQPLSVVDNVGFRSLIEHLEPRYNIPGRKFISTTALPELYNTVSSRLTAQLNDVKSMSFTTDIWSSSVSPMSLMSLTVHWVSPDNYAFNSAVLNVKKCRGSHTAGLIKDTMREMLDNWKIPLTKVHVVMRDNASNMKKGMDEVPVNSLGCLAHTLQLVVHEGLLSQRSVSDAIANGRRIVTHFKHSQVAQSRFEDIQKQLLQDTHRLQQDVQTRWNSSLYMIKSLLEQKRALCSYQADYDLPTTLSANEWSLLEKTVTVLEPFEEITKLISSATSTLADVIPAITVLKRLLTHETSTDSGIKTMKQTLLEAVNRRFSSTEGEPLYSVATLVDPRYKDRYFTGAVTANDARDALMREIRKVELLNDGAASATTEPAASTSTEDLASVDAEPVDAEPAEKVPRREEAAGSSQSRPKSSLTALYDNILEEQGDSGTGSNSDVALVQMQKYLKEPTISRSESPFQFWGKKHDSFPAVAAIAVRFLSAPSTSVESERLFSTTSNVVDEKRNRLTAEMTEIIIFLKKNLTKFS